MGPSVGRSDERDGKREAGSLCSRRLTGAETSVASRNGRRRSYAQSGTPGRATCSIAGHDGLGTSWLHGAVGGERGDVGSVA